jgi:hypothetical protein
MRWLLILVLSMPALAANDVYIAAASAGGNTGVDCANAKALSYFNSVGNWSASPTGIQIGPDTTAHLCGNFTGPTGADSYIQMQGSGTAGHPVTVKWETGAIVQAPYFSAAHGGVDMNGKTNIVIDGGTNGILQNTANGTGLANQQLSAMIQGSNCTNCQVKNLTIANVYVHSLATDASGGATYGINFQGGSGITIGPSNTIHDADVGFLYGITGTATNLRVTSNTLYSINQSIEVGNTGAFTLTGLTIDANIAHDWANWDDNTNSFHHNAVHLFTVSSAGVITGTFQVYNNYFYGDMGNHATSFMFFESNSGGLMGAPQIFNNVINHTSSANASPNGLLYGQVASGLLANNTFIDAGGSGGNGWNCLDLAASSWTVKNNIFQGCNVYVYLESGKTFTATDYNEYFGGPPNWDYQGVFKTTFATWKSACSCDANGNTSTPNLNGSFQPVATSGAIGAGTDLSGLAITALNSDKNGNARSAPWTIGALNAAGGGASFVPQAGGFLVQ